MKVKCTYEFYDLKEKVLRKIGDVFDVTEERFTEITCKGDWIEKEKAPKNTKKKEKRK